MPPMGKHEQVLYRRLRIFYVDQLCNDMFRLHNNINNIYHYHYNCYHSYHHDFNHDHNHGYIDNFYRHRNHHNYDRD